MSSRCADVRFRQSPSTNRMESASVAFTPASIACALDPASGGSRCTTLAPAAAARSPVPSTEPSSTTITWRAYAQPRHASTTAPTVGASLRAGTTTSTTTRPLRLRASREPRALAPCDDLHRHLARRLVDHLVAEHHRTLALALGGLLIGLEHVPRLVELLLVRREHLVENRHLIGVQGPLAVVSEDLCALAEVPEPLVVADLDVRPVDDLQAVGAAGHEDLDEDVMEVVARVLGDLQAAGERRHLHRRRHVDRAEDDRLQTRGCGADLFDVDDAASRLDLGLDADVARREAGVDLDLIQQEVEGHHLGRRLHLGEHDLLQALAGVADHLDDVAVGPLGVPRVDPDAEDLLAPVLVLDGVDRLGPRRLLDRKS